MRVSEIAIRNFPTIDKDARIKDAISTMSKKRIDRLIVIRDKDKLYGIITEFDILFKLSQRTVKRFQPYNISIAGATTTPVDTVYMNTYVKTAANMMLERGYSCLPVLDGEKLYGLVTKREIIQVFKRIEEEHGNREIRDVMDVVRGNVDLFHRLVMAQSKMRASGFDSLIVTHQNRFIGIVTALDIAKAIFTTKKLLPTHRWEHNLRRLLVVDVVNKDVDTLGPDDYLKDAVSILLRGRQRLVPIIEGEKVIGVLSRRHIIKYMLERDLL